MNQMVLLPDVEQQKEIISKVFEKQKAFQYEVAATSAKERIAKLDSLLEAIIKYKPEIRNAHYQDFMKPAAEVDLTEIYPVINEIKHTKRHLKRWMKNKKVSTPLAMLGSSSYIKYEPKGVALIISPWNFPFNLTFHPLISAVAAGNCAILKPSEHTPYVSGLMKKIIEEIFYEKEVAIFEGGIPTSSALLQLPFNHIFFTGSPEIGKVVMRAAAKNLCSVTLELGGKSPAIIDEKVDLKKAVTRIAWGKFTNAGQICIAPDYLLIHESRKEEFILVLKDRLKQFYTEEPQKSDCYARIINEKNFNRMIYLIDDAVEKGAKVEIGGTFDGASNFIYPTVLSDVPKNSRLMRYEIFGPVLPIVTYKHLDEAILHVKNNEKPLSLYIYSNSKKNIKKIIADTRAGTTCINHNTIHFSNMNLPFGGSNHSGIGRSHGFYGFEAFSHTRPILKQWAPLSTVELLLPPYSNLKQKLIDFTLRWL